MFSISTIPSINAGLSNGVKTHFLIYLNSKESIIEKTYLLKISPNPSLPKRGIPPFCKGREGGI
jgi:hypothetical protein